MLRGRLQPGEWGSGRPRAWDREGPGKALILWGLSTSPGQVQEAASCRTPARSSKAAAQHVPPTGRQRKPALLAKEPLRVDLHKNSGGPDVPLHSGDPEASRFGPDTLAGLLEPRCPPDVLRLICVSFQSGHRTGPHGPRQSRGPHQEQKHRSASLESRARKKPREAELPPRSPRCVRLLRTAPRVFLSRTVRLGFS